MSVPCNCTQCRLRRALPWPMTVYDARETLEALAAVMADVLRATGEQDARLLQVCADLHAEMALDKRLGRP